MNTQTVDRIVRPLITLAGMLIVLAFAAAALAAPPEPGTPEREAFERDRAAILAMAGEYRVTFDFRETVPLRAGYELKSPYHAQATEFVEVVEDAGDRIVLQHVLVLDGKEGNDAEPGKRVVKHWRQDWEYEATRLFEFRGYNTWAPRDLSADEVRGAWVQRVFQVDDSPRYQGFGKWVHDGSISTWTSNPTWRPLPRREWTKRQDYHVLVAVNRHTVTPQGWYHEQDNTKLVLDDAGQPAGDDAALVREIGVNTYLPADDWDFSAGREYWRKTGGYWADVRAAWADLFTQGRAIRLQKQVDGEPMFRHLFNGAKQAQEAGGAAAGAYRSEVDAVLAKLVVR